MNGIIKKSIVLGMAAAALADAFAQEEATLREAFAGKFLVGAALNVRQVRSRDEALQSLIREQFSSVVAENCMKAEEVQPEEGRFVFDEGDRLCDLAEKNGQVVTGHCLIWHSQAPRWFFTDKEGKEVSREVLIQRMKDHIYKVVGHYKGRVKGWDVVNEAVDGNGEFRKSPFYRIVGPEYIRLAFRFAREADPDAELYYNDYDMDLPRKREAVVALVKDLKEHGCRIDAVGMQSHVSFDTPLDEYEKSIEAFSAAGVKVMVTELDLSVLPWPKGNFGAAVETNFDYKKAMDPYRDGLTAEKSKQLNDFYVRLFDIYLRHGGDITRVTFWGVSDGDSWKNNWPIRGRRDYPLAFDRDLKPKPFVKTVIEMAKSGRYGE